jgi:hypothetical protein
MDMDGYEQWRHNNPRSYALWMARNIEDEGEAQTWLDRAADLEDYG